jgi:RNA polymerase sigma factor (sigma-70 family)
MSVAIADDELIAWVGRYILPHEPRLRAWLRSAFSAVEVDDVVQEAYCRIAGLARVDHIADPRQYLFGVARNVVLEQVRRNRVVRIETVSSLAELEAAMPQDGLSPERVVAGRLALRRVEALIAGLPERTRRVIRLRKIDGCSQSEIAEQLGISISVVENELTRGIGKLLRSLTKDERDDLPTRQRKNPPQISGVDNVD